MTFEKYLGSLNAKSISAVKRLILQTLWDASKTFPRDWVSSNRLLEITNQKYFDRRTRELRDETGCDIETRHINSEHQYRLKSDRLNQANPRAYLTAAEKKRLFISVDYKCAICGKQTEAGVRGLQADHKIPLNRGGSNEIGNWQAACNDCNVSKRRSCQGCEDECKICSWAFPDELGVAISLRLPVEVVDKIREQETDVPTWIVDLITKQLGR